jgi:hypothetical protein
MSAHASQRVRPGLSRFARLLVLVALAACCDGEEPLDDPPAPTTKVDACGGGCSSGKQRFVGRQTL